MSVRRSMIATVAALQLLSTPLLLAQNTGPAKLAPGMDISAALGLGGESSTPDQEEATEELESVPPLIMPQGEKKLPVSSETQQQPRVSNRPVQLDSMPDAPKPPSIPHVIPHPEVLPPEADPVVDEGEEDLPPFAFDEEAQRRTPAAKPAPLAQQPLPAAKAQQGLATTMPIVSIETSGPPESFVGRAETYSILVNNLGETVAHHVNVDVMLPRTASRVETAPQCQPVAPFHIRFAIGSLGVKEKKTVKVRLTPTARGGSEIRTQVTLAAASALSVQTKEARLHITAAGPAKLGFGQRANYKVTVTNQGDAAAEDVNVASALPEGVEIKVDGGGQLGYIGPGESRDIVVQVMPKLTGQVSLKFTARNKHGEKSHIVRAVEVERPMVEVVTQGPALNYLKRDGIYAVSVTNPGDASATNVKIKAAIPAGIHVTAIDRAAKYDAASRTLTWTLKHLASGGHEIFRYKATAIAEGRHAHDVLVTAAGGLRSESRHVTEVISRADVSMQIADTAGPVQVGSPAIFEVLVRNRGTKEAGNVVISVKLPVSLKPVRSTAYTSTGQSIRFPVISLPPGGQKVLRFEAVSDEAGDHIVQVSLRSDSLQRELSAEESIFFYESQKKPGNIATRPGNRVIDY